MSGGNRDHLGWRIEMTENWGAFSGRNAKRWTLRVAQVSLLVGLSGAASIPAWAQVAASDDSKAPPSGDQTAQASPAPAPAPSTQPEQEITVTAQRLNEARQNIEPAVGASVYNFSQQTIESMPAGENAPLNQVLLQAPGVNQDNLANGAIHVRNEHLGVQYRINGVVIPEGASFFGQGLSPRFVQSMNLITGTLPAEYGLRNTGVVDIQTKSGVFNQGGSVEMYGGSNWTMQPSAEYGGNVAGWNYYVAGDFLHSAHGINSPVPNYDAVHDNTNQEHGFGYAEKIIDPTSKISFILGTFDGRFEVPNNPGQTPAFGPPEADSPTPDGLLNGVASFDSNAQRASQRESANFGIASYLHTEEDFSYQVSVFSKYSTLSYTPDVWGDLAFTGLSQYALRQDFSNGLQADGSYHLTSTHTLRGGILMTGERTSADTNSQVLPVDDTGAPTSSTSFQVVNDSAKTGWTYSAYAQDEWKILPTVTINYGGRFDAIDTSSSENQLSPRINGVWNATQTTTLHAGYANYFSPPSFELASLSGATSLAGTSGAPPGIGNVQTGIKAERSHYFDVGITQEVPQVPGLKLGLDAYYKYARNLVDEGQFGAPIILTPFNYHVGYTKGVELTTSYANGPFSYYGNLAIGEEKAEGISSAQINFDAPTLAYSASHLVNTDHSQLMTASAGMSYLWQGTRYSVDIIAGTGVRTSAANVTDGTFNNGTVPSYEQVNFGVSHRFEQAPGGPIEIRADLINALDETYLIRAQQGIGVAAPQYGPRRTFFVGVRKFFN
jgi:outer membrane receptor protein involved in Fe transport